MDPDLPDVWGDRDRLFQVFENLIGNAIKFTKAGGSITQGIVEAHGGRIWVESTQGRGTTFAFTIPKVAPKSRLGPLKITSGTVFLPISTSKSEFLFGVREIPRWRGIRALSRG